MCLNSKVFVEKRKRSITGPVFKRKMIPNVPEPWYQMQNHANHKGSIGDFARSALTQCNLTSLEASLDLEHREIALVDEILFRNRPCSSSESWAISLEHGSGTPKWPRPLFPFAGDRFYCRFGESSSRKDETQFLQSIFVKKNLLRSSSNHIWLWSLLIYNGHVRARGWEDR